MLQGEHSAILSTSIKVPVSIKTLVLSILSGQLRRLYCLFVIFVALRSKSTAMDMAGWSVHLTTLFLGKLEQAVNQYFVHTLSIVTDNNPS